MKSFDWGLEGARTNGSICVLEYEDGQAFVVAEVFGEVGESPTEFAPSHDRARLIAAAPEMYEALRQCVDRFQRIDAFMEKNGPVPGFGACAFDAAEDMARAALAKATGGGE